MADAERFGAGGGKSFLHWKTQGIFAWAAGFSPYRKKYHSIIHDVRGSLRRMQNGGARL
ncbi:MAG: hypothetical protein MR698_03960 [Selenomonas sp.]|nr:hypothetical protein [Selenomonas sp.]